jgi:hypothetical protein
MQKRLETTITVPVPLHDRTPRGTLLSIVRQSELQRSLFETEWRPWFSDTGHWIAGYVPLAGGIFPTNAMSGDYQEEYWKVGVAARTFQAAVTKTRPGRRVRGLLWMMISTS